MKALIVVDVQNDFCPGGALAVKEGDRVVEPINRVLECFDLVVATQDWHPRNHESFAARHKGKNPGDMIKLHGVDQVLWPEHCVQHTRGAEFHPRLVAKNFSRIFQKGMNREVDSYSGFLENDKKRKTGLEEYLRHQNVTEIYIAGLATDYCVQFTALDGVAAGFKTFLIQDACRAVELAPGDGEKAIAAMRAKGVALVSSVELLKAPPRKRGLSRPSAETSAGPAVEY